MAGLDIVGGLTPKILGALFWCPDGVETQHGWQVNQWEAVKDSPQPTLGEVAKSSIYWGQLDGFYAKLYHLSLSNSSIAFNLVVQFLTFCCSKTNSCADLIAKKSEPKYTQPKPHKVISVRGPSSLHPAVLFSFNLLVFLSSFNFQFYKVYGKNITLSRDCYYGQCNNDTTMKVGPQNPRTSLFFPYITRSLSNHFPTLLP